MQPGEVQRIYWELLQTTEVVVRLIPVDADGKPVRVNLTQEDQGVLAEFATRIGLSGKAVPRK